MSSSNRQDLLQSSFANYLLREDIDALLRENISGNTSGALGRVFNELPPKDTRYTFLIPLIKLAENEALSNSNNNELMAASNIIPDSIKSKLQSWVDLACLTAMFDLFDDNGNVRTSIIDVLNKLKNHTSDTFGEDKVEEKFGLNNSDEIEKHLFSAYLLIIIQQANLVVTKLAANNDDSDNKNINSQFYFHYVNLALNQRLDSIKVSPWSIKQIYKVQRDVAYFWLKNDNDGLSQQMKLEFEKLLSAYGEGQEYLNFLCLQYKAANDKYTEHLVSISHEEQTAKVNVFATAEDIVRNAKNDPFEMKVEKIKLVTEVLKQTQAYKPENFEQYNKLVQEVDKHEWGKPLASAMPLVPVAVAAALLLATCVVFSLATGGVAIPFIAALSFQVLLGASIGSGVAGMATASACIYSMWHRSTHIDLVDTMKAVRGKQEIDEHSMAEKAERDVYYLSIK